MNRALISLTVFLGLAGAATAGETLEQKRDAKLAEPWLRKAAWITDYDKALAEAKASGRPIFADFTRSYAPCPYCTQIEQGVFSDPAFAEWSKDVVLLCHLTTGIATDPHQDLMEKKGGQGFPYLVFLDATGEVIAGHEGERTVAGLKASLVRAKAFLDLRKKAEGGDKAARFDLLEARYAMGSVTAEELEKVLKEAAPLSADQEAKAGRMRVNVEVRSVLATVTQARPTQIAAGKRFLEMKKAGRIPEGEQEMQPFWILMMGVADDQKDAALFEEGLNALKAKYSGREGTEGFFQQAETKLGQLKGAGR